MIIEVNFNQRKSDIEDSFRLLEFILEVETHLNKPILNSVSQHELYVTQEMQCVAKAQFLIVLYNLVESTVCDCLNSFYDAVLDEGLTYSALSINMKQMWRNYLKRKKIPDADKPDNELEAIPILFEELAVNISGSLDLRKILEVFSKHGCTLDDTRRDEIGDSFLVVKNKRNSLAHGNVSFSACGASYLLRDLRQFKDHIVGYMQEVVSASKYFIENGFYRV